jgi:hypothetical protein
MAACTEEKASRFAASPREGYLAGYYPHTRPSSLHSDDRLVRVRNWNEKLAWLYAVAAQDIPAGQYQWGLTEHEDGTYRIVIDAIYPA